MPQRLKPPASAHFVGFVAASIDGRISRESSTPPDWTSREDWQFFQRSLAKFDAVVVGRRTYEAVAARLRRRTTYVLSSRPKTTFARGTVTFVNPARVNLGNLLAGYRTVAVVGGAMVYRTMLERKLLNELYVTIEPLVLDRGMPMFTEGKKTVRMQLVAVRKLNRSGTLLLHYRVRP